MALSAWLHGVFCTISSSAELALFVTGVACFSSELLATNRIEESMMKKWHVVPAVFVLGVGLSTAYAQGRGGQGMGGQGMGAGTPGQRRAVCTGQGPGQGQGFKQGGRAGRGRGRFMMQNQTMQQPKQQGNNSGQPPVGNNQ